MAIFHLSVKFVSRGQGRSSVAAAAYRAGERLYNNYDGLTHDFTNKTGIAHKEIILPENAPHEFSDRQTLWNAVESAEKRKDARTAREIEIALPNELSLDENIELVRTYVAENFTRRGMCADVAIHSGHRTAHRQDEVHEEAQNDNIILPDNPHAHILVTTRPIQRDGFSVKKDRTWESPRNVHAWRESWANAQNREFERKGLEIRVTHESHADRGLDREPTIHMGSRATQMEERGIQTERGDINREIQARNRERDERERRRAEEREQNRTRRSDRQTIPNQKLWDELRRIETNFDENKTPFEAMGQQSNATRRQLKEATEKIKDEAQREKELAKLKEYDQMFESGNKNFTDFWSDFYKRHGMERDLSPSR